MKHLSKASAPVFHRMILLRKPRIYEGKTQKIQTLHQFINGDVWMFRFLMLFGIPGKEPKATVPNTYNFLMRPLPTA